MRKIKLYIASSLDNYIASLDGSIEWLLENNSPNNDYGYNEFLRTIDTTLMGYNTYSQILTFGEFPYKDKMNYVFTTKDIESDLPYLKFINKYAVRAIKELKEIDGDDIWLIGGGKLNSVLMDNDLIDEITIFIQPIILGSGIPLFANAFQTPKYNFGGSKTYHTGIVEFNFVKNEVL